MTESLFSMDGDVAPLADLAELARAAGAALMVDEAHAWASSARPAAVCAAAGVVPDVLIGTLGKAFGSFGGFVAGDRRAARHPGQPRPHLHLHHRPPPAVAAAALAALAIVRSAPKATPAAPA